MKRMLVLNYEFPPLGGGASPVSYELAEELSKTGEHDIDVVTMGFRGLAAYEEVNKNFRIHRVKCLRKKKEICQPWEQLTYLISGWKKCKELVSKNKYDICHTHFIIPTGILALRLKKKYGLPYIITSHGSDVLGYNARFKKLYPLLVGTWKNILDNAKLITSPSNFLKREISKAYPTFDPEKIIVIPNGIKEGKFKPLKKEKYILLVSRLTVNKGVQDFLKAIKNIDLGEWKVKIVGEGPYRQTLEKIVDDYNLREKVEFIGWVDNKSEQMKELYGHSSVFVLASHFENMNITLLESMQAGCHVIAKNVGGNVEVVGSSGMTYQNEIELVQLLNLHIDSKKLPDLNRTTIENFEWPSIINTYKQLLCEKGMETELFVTIDTEPDCDIHWSRSNPLSFTSVTYGIPELLRPIWDKYSIKPIYFVSPEVVMDSKSCEVLKEEARKGAIIGAHLHSEYIEPNITIKNPAGKPSNEFPCFAHDAKTEYQKIKNLTDLIEKNIGVRPIWYRAARYGADMDTIRSLAKLDYKYDSSVTPSIDWSSIGGPNHSEAPAQPYRISETDYYRPSEENYSIGIKEYPITIAGKRFGLLGKFLPDNWFFYNWLRPTHMTVIEQKNLCKKISEKGIGEFVMMFHSMEVIPNATPFVRSVFQQKRFISNLIKTISYIQNI